MASVKKLKASHIKVTYSIVFCCFKSTCKEECLQTDWSGAPVAQWLYTSHTAPLTSVELHKLLVNEAILNWKEEWSKGAVDPKDKVRRVIYLFLSLQSFQSAKMILMPLQSQELSFKENVSEVGTDR